MSPARKNRRGGKRVAKPRKKPPSSHEQIRQGPEDDALRDEHIGANKPPVEYTHRLSEQICARLANGESGAEICREKGMPSWQVLSHWVRTKPEFAKRYRIAREMGCEYWADEIIMISDDARNDYVDRLNRRGEIVGRALDREHFERGRLRVQCRQWVASKILRATYGDNAALMNAVGAASNAETRNSLIDSIVKLVSPKTDGRTKPDGKQEEQRER